MKKYSKKYTDKYNTDKYNKIESRLSSWLRLKKMLLVACSTPFP